MVANVCCLRHTDGFTRKDSCSHSSMGAVCLTAWGLGLHFSSDVRMAAPWSDASYVSLRHSAQKTIRRVRAAFMY